MRKNTGALGVVGEGLTSDMRTEGSKEPLERSGTGTRAYKSPEPEANLVLSQDPENLKVEKKTGMDYGMWKARVVKAV
jgi:hypothetical protein